MHGICILDAQSANSSDVTAKRTNGKQFYCNAQCFMVIDTTDYFCIYAFSTDQREIEKQNKEISKLDNEDDNGMRRNQREKL